jgi:hypothetical protein
MADPDSVAQKTLGWARWQTWVGVGSLLLGVVGLAIMLAGPHMVIGSVRAVFSAQVPLWIVLLGLIAGWTLQKLRRTPRDPEPNGYRWFFFSSPAPGAAPEAPLSPPTRSLDESFQEEHDGVLWRGELFKGRVLGMEPHCPSCKARLVEHSASGLRGGWRVVCDVCNCFEKTFSLPKGQVRDRIQRSIEAAWIRRGEEV